ncbi:MAG: T9SS type A sorting domain-containing protein [Bacteroidales bacterium]|nr:T9SS type A sorting domain-containing protein [Bacteroidales bacterium]
MRILIIAGLLISSLFLQAQDTLRFMQYNLLMYGNDFGGCNQSNNNLNDKNQYLNKIVEYFRPDVLTVNEIYKADYIHEYLMSNALNVNGVDYFEKGNPPNLANSYIVNQVFYNKEKLSLESDIVIETGVRDIDIFKLKYQPANSGDPVYIHCIVAHLKAGNSYEDEIERSNETNKLMNYLSNSNASGNYLMMGDFNVYSSSEPAFQNLVNYQNNEVRFYDPINRLGEWNNFYVFSDVHTQSTHTDGDCASGGGMDDRFDFILASDEIIDGTNKAKYVPGSYRAIGQDGEHFNKSLLDSPQNTTVPVGVLNALYGMSDHLPVVLELAVGDNVGISQINNKDFRVSILNPVSDGIELRIKSSKPVQLNLAIVNLQGQTLTQEFYEGQGTGIKKLSIYGLPKGIYFLIVKDRKKGSSAMKFMKF